MKKLHIFSFNQHWFHLGSMVENALEHKNEFHEIRISLFQQKLRTLPIDMHFRFPLSSFFRNSPEKIAVNYLKSMGDIRCDIVSLEKVRMKNIDLPIDIGELKRLRIEDLQIGMAIASHLISLRKDSQPRIEPNSGLIRSCLQFYFDLENWFSQQRYDSEIDEIWVCNGRTFHERVVVELAKKNNLKVSFYEIGGEGLIPNRWILHDVSPHDRKQHQSEILKHSEIKNPILKDVEDWFIAHEDPKKNHFASKRIDHEKMKEISSKPFIVFFSSSDDEVAAISSEWDSPWGSQLAAVNSVIDVFAEQSKYNFVIRVHPNQGNKSKRDRKAWKNLAARENCFIFNYDESVNSYDLMRRSSAVLTHGSTMGVEAAFRKKPQAFLSPARFDQLIPAEKLADKTAIKNWLERLESPEYKLDAREYKGAILWANYMLTAGSSWKYVSIGRKSGRIAGFLEGKNLRPATPYVALTRWYVTTYRGLIENRLGLFKWN